MNTIVVLWSLAGFINFVVGMVFAEMTLTPAYSRGRHVPACIGACVADYLMVFIGYSINLYSDFITAFGQCVLICIVLYLLYRERVENKLFVGLTASLLASVLTFICGAIDTVLGMGLHMFDEGTPYNVRNIIFFICIKLVVFSIIFILYRLLLRNKFREILSLSEGQMSNYLIAPVVSIIGFYVINNITNSVGILPTSPYFIPLYLTVCIIFMVEYLQIFSSIRWTAQARKSEAEKERIGADLKVATQIQADMLPRIFPPFPERKEFDLYATMDPAKEVGGDFYDFFLVDEDHLGLVMADVSGKGVPAALFMVIAKTLIKNRALMGGSPAEVLAYANNQLCEGNEAELFVTVWMAIIEISTGKGMAANAGHEHPAIRRAGGEWELVVYRHSPAVATMEGMRFREHEFTLEPGDSLYVYTDGVPEATNADNELYGTDRMLAALNRDPGAEPEKLLGEIKTDVDAFVGEAPQFDDITMLGITWYGRR